MFFAFFYTPFIHVFLRCLLSITLSWEHLKWYSDGTEIFSASTTIVVVFTYQTSIRWEKLLHDRQFFRHTSKHAFIFTCWIFLCWIVHDIYIHIVTSHRYIVLLFCASIPFSRTVLCKKRKKRKKNKKRKELNMSFLKVVVQRVCGNILTYKPWCYMELF